jgi:hypothetical protein
LSFTRDYIVCHINQVQKKHLIIRASGTPPTRVLTVNNPQLAASNMAMQKASVNELPKGKNQIRQIGEKYTFHG